MAETSGVSYNKQVGNNETVVNIFENASKFKDVTRYRLMRGVPDFGNLVQFNPYETGYALFFICGMPKFIEALARENAYYRALMMNWMHIIEYEFKSFDGLDDITVDTTQLGDDLNPLNVITKVNMQGGQSEFSLTYDEKKGGIFTKFHKLYLTGLKYARTQVKGYHGLIHSGKMEPGFENEVFTFLYVNTDNTMMNVEAAYLLLACQLNSVESSMFNYTKGTIDKREITVKFSGYPVQSRQIDAVAKDYLTYLRSDAAGARQIYFNDNNYTYSNMDKAFSTLSGYGANIAASNMVSTEAYNTLNKNGNRSQLNTSNYFKNDNSDTYGVIQGESYNTIYSKTED